MGTDGSIIETSGSLRRRLLSQSYDSVKQAGSGTRTELRHPYLGRLRLDLILSGSVVLTDANLLDGSWLRSQCPSDLAAALSFLDDAPGLIVRHRADTIGASPLGFVTDEANNIKPFRFSSLPEGLSTCIEQHLIESMGNPAPQTLDELQILLERATGGDSEIAQMVRSWKRWAEYVDGGAQGIASEKWDRRLDMRQAVETVTGEMLRITRGKALDETFAFDESLWTDPEAMAPVADVCGASAKHTSAILTRVANGEWRTATYAKIDDSAETDEAKEKLKRLVDRAFGLGFRAQHGAVDFDDDRPLALHPVGKFMPGMGSKKVSDELLDELAEQGWCAVDAPSDYLARLALISTGDLCQWYIENKELIHAWWREGSGSARGLRQALKSLEKNYLPLVTEANIRKVAGLAPQFTLKQRIERYSEAAEPVKKLALAIPPIGDVVGIFDAIGALGEMTWSQLTSELNNASMLSSDIAIERRQGA